VEQNGKVTAADATVIIITLNRPDYVKRCLDCLVAQTEQAGQIIVVDASPDPLTLDVCADYQSVLYLRNENGFGRMTKSRNIGLRSAKGSIIAFLDDDSFAEPEWLAQLLTGYSDSKVGAVGGRALNNQPNEEMIGVTDLGKIKKDGQLCGFFAADPGRIIEVDHVMGCNMSFRREVLAQLGGFREDYPGISGLCEDTDMCLRVKRLGYRILFVPAARVFHVGAPQAVGRRFDTRWMFFNNRNFSCLLMRNFGPFSKLLWAHLIFSNIRGISQCCRKIGSAVLHLSAYTIGGIIGLLSAFALIMRSGYTPLRTDAVGEELRQLLASPATPAQTSKSDGLAVTGTSQSSHR